MTPTELEQALAQFTGTEHYYRLMGNVILTDGARFLATEAGAFWLMDMVASHLSSVPKQEYMAFAQLVVRDSAATFTLSGDLDDGKALEVYARQEIEYTDFPLPRQVLYVVSDGSNWVVMLPSEY